MNNCAQGQYYSIVDPRHKVLLCSCKELRSWAQDVKGYLTPLVVGVGVVLLVYPHMVRVVRLRADVPPLPCQLPLESMMK